MNHIIHKSSIINLKSYINEFNFAEPDWSLLPSDFPYCNAEKLTTQEQLLFSGIKLAWYGTQRKGIHKLYLQSAYLAGLSLVVISFLFFAKTFLSSPGWQYTKEVSAATISATLRTSRVHTQAENLNEIIESTMSGILK